MNYATTITRVAKYFLNKDSMSLRKLQILCYFSQTFYVYYNNEESTFKYTQNLLFKGDFKARVMVTENTKLNMKYNKYRDTIIPEYRNTLIPKYEKQPYFNKILKKVLDRVWEQYHTYDEDTLIYQFIRRTPSFVKAREGLKSYESPRTNIKIEDYFKDYYTE